MLATWNGLVIICEHVNISHSAGCVMFGFTRTQLLIMRTFAVNAETFTCTHICL